MHPFIEEDRTCSSICFEAPIEQTIDLAASLILTAGKAESLDMVSAKL